MHVLIITFELDGLADTAYRAQAEASAAAIAQAPGLLAKVWLADAASATYGGVYLFESEAAIADYLTSDAVGWLRTNSQVTNLRTRTFATIAPATRLTQGRLALVPEPARA